MCLPISCFASVSVCFGFQCNCASVQVLIHYSNWKNNKTSKAPCDRKIYEAQAMDCIAEMHGIEREREKIKEITKNCAVLISSKSLFKHHTTSDKQNERQNERWIKNKSKIIIKRYIYNTKSICTLTIHLTEAKWTLKKNNKTMQARKKLSAVSGSNTIEKRWKGQEGTHQFVQTNYTQLHLHRWETFFVWEKKQNTKPCTFDVGGLNTRIEWL